MATKPKRLFRGEAKGKLLRVLEFILLAVVLMGPVIVMSAYSYLEYKASNGLDMVLTRAMTTIVTAAIPMAKTTTYVSCLFWSDGIGVNVVSITSVLVLPKHGSITLKLNCRKLKLELHILESGL